MNYPYDELQEDVKEHFLVWFFKLGAGEDEVYYAAMGEFEGPEGDFSIGEKICVHTFLFRIYMENDLYSERVLMGMNELFKNKEEIQQELGEDYDRLLKEIDIIMDKYWRRAKALSLHELMALYRWKGEELHKIISDAKNIIDKVVQEENIIVEDIFYVATRRIEYALQYSDDTIISVSLVDDLSYDFTVYTVYNEDLDEIIYNHTQSLVSLDDLYYVLRNDLNRQKI